MPSYTFPNSIQLQQIAQTKLPRLTASRAGFDIMPMTNVDADTLAWEQMDNYTGLQQVRGLGGDPARVNALGGKRYLMEPGTYGEFRRIDETELVRRRQWGSLTQFINVSDLVMQSQDHLLGRRLDRIESVIWTLLTAGTFSVLGYQGAVLHTDTFTLQTFTASPAWGTVATAHPLADFRSIQLLSEGYSVNFGAAATAYMNRRTFNLLMSNTNNSDLAGRRTAGLATVLSPASLNQVLAGEDLPTIQIYHEGYIDDTNTFQLFIPNNKVVVVGQRPAGQVVGEYRMVRDANNADLGPGPYMKVIDRGEDTVPRTIEVHDGHRGGPVIYFPSAIVVMTV